MTDWQRSAVEVDQPNPQPEAPAPPPIDVDEHLPPTEEADREVVSPPLPATEANDGAAIEPGRDESQPPDEPDEPGAPAPDAAFSPEAGVVAPDAPAPAPVDGAPVDAAPVDAAPVDGVSPVDAVAELAGVVVEPQAGDAPGVSPSDPVPDPDAPPLTHAAIARARPLPRAVAIANQKGGVGKTTTAVNLGAGLADLGYRVLVVDLDPQGNATTGLGINPRNLTGSVYDVLMNDAPLEDCVEPTAVRNLFVVPATIDLAGAEIELVPAFSRELKLRRAIDRLAGEFDFTLIDCPPSLGLLTVNGLAAAGEVLVPIQCEYYALEGLGQLIKNIQLVQSNLNPRLELSTIVLTMFDARTRLSDQVAKDVRAHFGTKVCRTIVPRTVRLSEAPSFGQPINVFDPTSRGATAYRELAKEVSGGTARRSG